MKKLNKLLSLAMLLLFLTTGINNAFATIVTVTLVDESGVALSNYPPSGSEMSYKYRCGGSWVGGGNVQTDALGQFVTSDITCSNWDGKITISLHQKSKEEVVSGSAVTFQAARVNVNLKNECTGLVTATSGTVAQGGGHWYTHGSTAGTGVVSFYTFPGGTVKVRMNYHWASRTQYAVIAAGVNEVDFLTTTVDYSYDGVVKHQSGSWNVMTFPFELLQGNHNIKFGSTLKTIAISGCAITQNVHIFTTKKADGSALPNIKISRNDYGNHYVTVGYTDANGKLFTTDQPNGTWKFRAYKDHTQQYKTSVPSIITFKTAKFMVHAKKSDCTTDFEGIKASFNDYGNHYLSMGYTDANGLASIELFPGNYKFKAYKDHTEKTGMLNIATSGATDEVVLITAKFVVHVKKADGTDFAGIKASFNDYGNHYLSMGNTDVNGFATIELFPGNRKFKAYKDHTFNTAYLEILNSCSSDNVEFQTAEVISYAEDCDEDTPVAGIKMSFNDYGNHYLSMGTTGADGKTGFELFPGTGYKFKAYTIHTFRTETVDLPATGVTIEYNPIRLDFNYPGVVKFNDYGNHWLTIPDDTYIFPGVFEFKFAGVQRTLDLSALCSIEGIAFVHAEYSDGSPIVGNDVTYYYWPGPAVIAGQTNANGNKMIFFTEPVTNVAFTFEYNGFKQVKTQNIHTDPIVNFNTVAVTMKLQDHDGDGSTDDLTGNEATSLTVYKWPTTKTFGSGTTTAYLESMELLPLTYNFAMKYEGVGKTISQNLNTDQTVVFETVLKTLDLKDHAGGLTNLSGDAVEVTYYKWPYTGTFGDGVLDETDSYFESMDLFDFSYKYGVKYKGIVKTITTDAEDVTFQTKEYTLNLVDHTGGTANLVGDAINATYYKWPYTGTFGDGVLAASDGYAESMDLFEFAYKFSIKYAQHSNTITGSGNVQFQTGAVEDIDGTCYKYYKWPASGTFTNFMELLPKSYKFYFSNPGQPDVTCTVVAGMTLEVPGCLTKESIATGVKRFASFHFNVYPSPFKDQTTIAFKLDEEQSIKVLVFDIQGNLVDILQNGTLPKGDHHLKWKGHNMSGQEVLNGMYIIKFISKDRIGHKQLIKQ